MFSECESQEAIKIDVAINCYDYSIVPNVLGERWAQSIRDRIRYLSNSYGDKFEKLMVLSMRFYTYSVENYSEFMRDSVPVKCLDHYEGWATTLYSEFDNVYSEIYNTVFPEIHNDGDIFQSVAIYFFFVASDCYKNDKIQALSMLFEVSNATSLANGHYMWEGSKEFCDEKLSINGKRGIKKRNIPWGELNEFAIKLYKEKSWPSPHSAAVQLKDKIVAHAETIKNASGKGIKLSEERAKDTIHGWFLKYEKEKKQQEQATPSG